MVLLTLSKNIKMHEIKTKQLFLQRRITTVKVCNSIIILVVEFCKSDFFMHTYLWLFRAILK